MGRRFPRRSPQVGVTLVMAVIVAAAGFGPGPGAPDNAAAAPPPTGGRISGVSASFDSSFGNRAQRIAGLRRMAAIGVGVDRVDALWDLIERTPGVYDWSSLDYRIQEINDAGLTPRVILGFGNPLYSSRGAAAAGVLGRDFGGLPPFGIGAPRFFPPDDTVTSLSAFARWAAALATRYRGRAHLFEVWNEENGGYRFWEPREDPAWYGDLLAATYDAVKQAAPGATVAFGGTFFPGVDAHALGVMGVAAGVVNSLALPSMGSLEFINAALSAHPDLGRHFDALAYHPYHFPYYGPEVDIPFEGTTEASMVQVRRLLDAHGLASKPIWITEVGWPNNTCAYGVPPAKSASFLVRTYALAWAHGIDQVDWYTYGDGPQSCVNQEAAFGVFDATGKPKPAYGAWATLDRILLPLRFVDDQSAALKLPPNGRALRFGSSAVSVTVAWLAPETLNSDTGALPSADARAQVALPPGVVAVYDMGGTRLPLAPTFEASPYPVYLVVPAPNPPASVGPAAGLPNTSR